MATSATGILFKHLDLLDSETHALMNWPGREGFFARVRFVEDVEESLALRNVSGALIISASGMCDAGRIKYHLRHNLPQRESSILIIGFQAAGSLGRRLVDGDKTVRIFGGPVPVRAAIYTIGGPIEGQMRLFRGEALGAPQFLDNKLAT